MFLLLHCKAAPCRTPFQTRCYTAPNLDNVESVNGDDESIIKFAEGSAPGTCVCPSSVTCQTAATVNWCDVPVMDEEVPRGHADDSCC